MLYYKKRVAPVIIVSAIFLGGCSIHEIRLSQGCGVGTVFGVAAGFLAGGDAGAVILTTFVSTILGCEAARKIDDELLEATNEIENYIDQRNVTVHDNNEIIVQIERISSLVKEHNRQIAISLTDENVKRESLEKAQLAVRKLSKHLRRLYVKIGYQIDKIAYGGYTSSDAINQQLGLLKEKRRKIAKLLHMTSNLVVG